MYALSPAYDLLATVLAIRDDPEECALTLNGKKARLVLADFQNLAVRLNLSDKVWEGICARYRNADMAKLRGLLSRSFLSEGSRERYEHIIKERLRRLFG
jgi:serine/threonine-protein kinase HipA